MAKAPTVKRSGRRQGLPERWLMIPKRGKGSHIILVKDGSMATLSVPNHKTVARGTLRSLIRDSGLTVDEFIKLT